LTRLQLFFVVVVVVVASSIVVGEARGVFWNYPKYSNHPKTKRASPQRSQ